MSRKRRIRPLVVIAGAVVTLGAGIGVPVHAAMQDGLDKFYNQQVEWSPCKAYPPPDPSELPDGDDWIIIDPWEGQWGRMDCAVVQVPMNYRDPGAGTLKVAVSRMKATNAAQRKGVLVLNPGGPGGGGLNMPLRLQDQSIAEHFDLIGFDPRGVGPSSTALRCARIPDHRPTDSRPGDDQFSLFADYAREHEKACQSIGGSIRPFINTANTARDMDVIRGVLGEKKINYLGFSYGTYLGAVYGSLFPERLNRSVLDSSIHPGWLWHEQWKRQSVGVRFNVDHWAAWVGERDSRYHLGKNRQQVLATVESLAAKLATRAVKIADARPEAWPFYWPKELDRTELDTFLGQGTQVRPVWDVLAEVIGEARQAATAGTAMSRDASTAIGRLHQEGTGKVDDGTFDTVTCEADWPTDLKGYYQDMREVRARSPYQNLNAGGVTGAAPTNCTFRSFTPPEKLVPLRRSGYPAGIVVQSDGDTATQYEGGPAMAAVLNHRLISIRDNGVHGHYGANACVTGKVNTYLIDGVLPPTKSDCADEPRPPIPADGASIQSRSVAKTKASRVESALERHSVWQ